MLDKLSTRHWLKNAIDVPAPHLRRAGFFLIVVTTLTLGTLMMADILQGNGTRPLEVAILALFSVTFGWIAVAFWTAVAGFLLQLFGLDALSLRRRRGRLEPQQPIVTRTAVIMPAYNEETRPVIAGLEATYLDVLATREAEHFDFYLLSDSNDLEIAAAEEAAWEDLRRRLRADDRQPGLFYRRRTRNDGRKPGNIAEFCRRWGGHYEHMIVLDADSVMSGRTLVALVRAMQANPRAGMIQTVPLPVRQETVFGRFVQFADGLYGPMLATGLAFWQTDTANYWGHNAILRVRPFMRHCGLPSLPGKPPRGGEILSHDFVEAALIRRGGWQVYLLSDLEGSYEEVPSNMLDYAKRDRRWVEGNLQHLRLLNAHGLHPLNRLYFLMGGLAYLCSFLWLLMLLASTADALSLALTEHRFFGPAYQLFPNWPIAKPSTTMSLLTLVIAMLFVPKLMGIMLCLLYPERRRAFGGTVRLLFSSLLEMIFSVLIAPVMMTFHALFVASVLLGRRVTWGPQHRQGRFVPWSEALRYTVLASLCAVIWGVCSAAVTPIFFLTLTPVLVGLILAAPLITLSSSAALGAWLRARGVFLTPSETAPADVLRHARRLLASPARRRMQRARAPALSQRLPRELHLEMPVQRLDAAPTAVKPRVELAEGFGPPRTQWHSLKKKGHSLKGMQLAPKKN